MKPPASAAVPAIRIARDTVVEILRVEALPGKDPRYGGRFIDLSQTAARMLETFIANRLR